MRILDDCVVECDTISSGTSHRIAKWSVHPLRLQILDSETRSPNLHTQYNLITLSFSLRTREGIWYSESARGLLAYPVCVLLEACGLLWPLAFTAAVPRSRLCLWSTISTSRPSRPLTTRTGRPLFCLCTGCSVPRKTIGVSASMFMGVWEGAASGEKLKNVVTAAEPLHGILDGQYTHL